MEVEGKRCLKFGAKSANKMLIGRGVEWTSFHSLGKDLVWMAFKSRDVFYRHNSRIINEEKYQNKTYRGDLSEWLLGIRIDLPSSRSS
jgi:hypothetical protein